MNHDAAKTDYCPDSPDRYDRYIACGVLLSVKLLSFNTGETWNPILFNQVQAYYAKCLELQKNKKTILHKVVEILIITISKCFNRTLISSLLEMIQIVAVLVRMRQSWHYPVPIGWRVFYW